VTRGTVWAEYGALSELMRPVGGAVPGAAASAALPRAVLSGRVAAVGLQSAKLEGKPTVCAASPRLARW
jgi:hypothetical protein